MTRRLALPPTHAVSASNSPDLESAKRASVGQLLLKCARLFNERAMHRVNERGAFPVLRPAHTNIFPHIDFDGIRVVDLARKLGISKQAVSQTVAELAEFGVVELLVDPSDARAKLVRFTDKGRDAIAHGLGILHEIEHELEPRVGAHHMAALHEALRALETVLVADGLTPLQTASEGSKLPNGEALAKPKAGRARSKKAR